MPSSSSHQSPAENKVKVKKKFAGDEPLDPKMMTMQDLIFWNPKNEKSLYDDAQKKKKGDSSEFQVLDKSKEKAVSKPAFVAPQVKIAEDGSLVIDESSLTVVKENGSEVWETVQEDHVDRKLNSMSFRKRPCSRGNPWSDIETDLFYDVLRATGPDFGLMHEFIPSRTRIELKAKYNREERFNWARLNEALSIPTLLSDALYSHANEIIDVIKEADIKKKVSKLSKDISDYPDKQSAVNYDHPELKEQSGSAEKKPCVEDLSMQKKLKEVLLEEAAKEAAVILEKRKCERRKDELRRICEQALSKLNKDFPKFKIVIDENAKDVTVEGNPDLKNLPVVRMPLGTITRVLPADEIHPQRVLFECNARKATARQYIIQHQLGPRMPTTGFLHLAFKNCLQTPSFRICGGQLGESFQPAINAPRLCLIGHVIATAQSCPVEGNNHHYVS
ncbi:unnamed protein product [Thelazia callipaeda]|uniref:SANT domain-containing protein n=1 Tax=Thelazia callipaeda TaxID=103827 RepID=A0A0N5D135_THECL|nr:unnamed protein product [Thelazia callipaeda]